MEKDTKHVSPTLDIMAKKIATLWGDGGFHSDILNLDICGCPGGGTQLHKKDFDGWVFQPRWMFGLSWMMELVDQGQVHKQHYFLNPFSLLFG